MNMKKYVSQYVSLGAAAVLIGMVGIAVPVLADTAPPTNQPPQAWGMRMGRGRGPGMMRQGVFGTVSGVSGNTVTVSGRQGFGTTTPATTFTVDATNAKIMKGGATGTISSIALGDTVAVEGTITGNSVVATMIRDGVMKMGPGMGPRGPNGGNPASPLSTGDGQPIVGGTISAINGSSIMIKNKSNVEYIVDGTNAKVTQGPNTITLSTLKVGDSILAQGAINGTSVTATSITDQSRPAGNSNNATSTPKRGGIFGGIAQFFSHLFGF